MPCYPLQNSHHTHTHTFTLPEDPPPQDQHHQAHIPGPPQPKYTYKQITHTYPNLYHTSHFHPPPQTFVFIQPQVCVCRGMQHGPTTSINCSHQQQTIQIMKRYHHKTVAIIHITKMQALSSPLIA